MDVQYKYLIGSIVGETRNLCYLQKVRVDYEWGPIDSALTFDSFEEAMKWIMEYGSVHLGLDHGFSLISVSNTALNKVTGKNFDRDLFMKLHDPIYMLR